MCFLVVNTAATVSQISQMRRPSLFDWPLTYGRRRECSVSCIFVEPGAPNYEATATMTCSITKSSGSSRKMREGWRYQLTQARFLRALQRTRTDPRAGSHRLSREKDRARREREHTAHTKKRNRKIEREKINHGGHIGSVTGDRVTVQPVVG